MKGNGKREKLKLVPVRRGRGSMRFSSREWRDLLAAWAVMGAIIAFSLKGSVGSLGVPMLVLLSVGVAGFSVILHELAHKAAAIRYGASAMFSANYPWLIASLALSAFTGFLFLAPGAVMVSGVLTRRQVMVSKAAGPATNLVLALLSGLLSVAFASGPVGLALYYSFRFNAMLAAFNLIPVSVLDGKAIWDTSRGVWFALAVPAAVMVFAGEALLAFGLLFSRGP